MKQFVGSLSSLVFERPSIAPRISVARDPRDDGDTRVYRARYMNARAWWSRPRRPQPLVNGDTLTMMHVDTTYSSIPGQRPIIELHGVTETGQSVFVNVHNFVPYFFVRFPRTLDPSFTPSVMVSKLETKLEARLKNNAYYGKRSQYCERWEMVTRRDILYYNGDEDDDFDDIIFTVRREESDK